MTTPSVKGTKTEQNLLKAFAGESQARMRYTLFAQVARDEGYDQIAAIFEETAHNEREHAKRFFSFLEGGMLEITAAYPAGVVGNTYENLIAAAEGELEEWSELYPAFAEEARREGFPQIGAVFELISRVEKEHEERYTTLANNVKNGLVFKKTDLMLWKCRECGYIHKSEQAPGKCPACLNDQKYFELQSKNY
jgi:rubrerythrin